MPRALRFADRAVEDLHAIERWQKQPGAGASASRRLDTIRGAIQRLRHNPCLYPLGDRSGIRELTIERHRVLYTVDPDTGRNDTAGDVTILRIFRPGQSRDAL